MNSEITVSNSFAIVVLFGGVLFLGKSVYDLIKSNNLSRAEKVKLAFCISIIPIYGSLVFYMYEKNKRHLSKQLGNQ